MFKNKAIKSSKNLVSLVGNVADWVSLGGNDVVRDCMGDSFALGGNLVFGVAFVVNVTVKLVWSVGVCRDGNVVLGGTVAVGVSLGGSIAVRARSVTVESVVVVSAVVVSVVVVSLLEVSVVVMSVVVVSLLEVSVVVMSVVLVSMVGVPILRVFAVMSVDLGNVCIVNVCSSSGGGISFGR